MALTNDLLQKTSGPKSNISYTFMKHMMILCSNMKMASENVFRHQVRQFRLIGRCQYNLQTYPWQIQPKVEKVEVALRLRDLFG